VAYNRINTVFVFHFETFWIVVYPFSIRNEATLKQCKQFSTKRLLKTSVAVETLKTKTKLLAM